MKEARSLSFYLSILFLFVFSHSVEARFWRFELGAFGMQTEYVEERPTQIFLEKDFTQTSAGIQAEFQWYFIPKWFYFNLEVDYAKVMSSNTVDEFDSIVQVSQIGLSLPSRPFNLSLVAEQSYNQMQTNNAGFGFDNFNSIQFFPQLDFTTPGGFMTIYGKIPLVSLLSTEKSEYVYGAIFRMGDKSAPWPEAYFIPGWNLKVEYREIEIEFPAEIRPVTINTKSISVGLTYSF